MEKVILRLIGDLSTLLDCPNMWCERLADYEPLPTETIKTLDNELPNLLQYCKRVSVSPEVKVLMNLLAEVINKYGTTSGVSPYRYSGYTVNAFADTTREIEETCIYSLDKDLANSCKPWLYWLYQYFPPQASEGVDELPTVKLQELPTEIDTEQARKYFARAVAAGLMSEQFEWLASQSLLACFCREMSVNLGLGKGYSSEGQKRLSWKPFEALFNVKAKNLTTSLNDIKKPGQDPIGIEKVEAIFKD